MTQVNFDDRTALEQANQGNFAAQHYCFGKAELFKQLDGILQQDIVLSLLAAKKIPESVAAHFFGGNEKLQERIVGTTVAAAQKEMRDGAKAEKKQDKKAGTSSETAAAARAPEETVTTVKKATPAHETKAVEAVTNDIMRDMPHLAPEKVAANYKQAVESGAAPRAPVAETAEQKEARAQLIEASKSGNFEGFTLQAMTDESDKSVMMKKAKDFAEGRNTMLASTALKAVGPVAMAPVISLAKGLNVQAPAA